MKDPEVGHQEPVELEAQEEATHCRGQGLPKPNLDPPSQALELSVIFHPNNEEHPHPLLALSQSQEPS